MIIVSACLAGMKCNYKGESKPNEKVISLIKKGKAIPICPEQLGGLCTPRSGARIIGTAEEVLEGKSKLMTDDGNEVTDEYITGAEETLRIAQEYKVKAVILKQGSPSCGKGKTQGGKDKRELVNGDGITVALLKKNRIQVFTEEDDEIQQF